MREQTAENTFCNMQGLRHDDTFAFQKTLHTVVRFNQSHII